MANSTKRDIDILAVSRVTRSIAAGMINVAFPYYILKDLHYGAFVIGLIYVFATIATAVFGFLSGFTTDVWGKRGTLVITSALLPVSAVLVFLSQSLWLIIPAAMLGGYSATGSLAGGGIGGAVQPIQNTILSDLTDPEKRTNYFSVFTFLAGVAGALGALLAKPFDVRQIFIIAAVISAIGIPALFYLSVKDSTGKIGVLKTKSTIGKFSLTGMLNGFSQGLVVPFLIPFFVLVYHVPKNEMSAYVFASGLLGSFALLAAPLLEKLFGFVKSIVISRGLGMILFIIFPIIHYLPLAVVIYVIAPALRVIALPIQQSEMTRRVDENELGRALGINQTTRLAASSLATLLGGIFLDAALFELPFFIYGGVMTGNLYLYTRFFGTKKAPIPDDEDAAEVK